MLWMLVLGGACTTSPRGEAVADAGGSDRTLGIDTGAERELPLRLSTRVVPLEEPGTSLLATGTDRLAGYHVRREGEIYCPDCNTIARRDCPAACARDHLMRTEMDHGGQALASPTALHTFFPPNADQGIEILARRGDADGNVDLVYGICDNAPCGVGVAARSCTTYLASMDASGARRAPDVELYASRWGDVELRHNARTGELLLLYAPPDWGSRGAAQVMILDRQRQVARPWVALGSDLRVSEAVVADGEGFVVALGDRSPGGEAKIACATSCDCVNIVSTLPPETALLTYRVSAAEISPARAIEGGRALTKPHLLQTAEGLMLLGRIGESLHTYHLPRGANGWRELPQLAAPTSDQWLLAFADLMPASTRGNLLIFGGDWGEQLSQQLIAGSIDTAGDTRRLPVGDHQPVYYFDFTHTLWRAPNGRARLFIQRAVWPPAGAEDWERWEVLRVDIDPL